MRECRGFSSVSNKLKDWGIIERAHRERNNSNKLGQTDVKLPEGEGRLRYLPISVTYIAISNLTAIIV